MSDSGKKKCWLKHNAIDLVLGLFAITWFVWAYEINISTIFVITLVVASAKAIVAYVKWVAIDTGQLMYKGHTYYVVSKEQFEKIFKNDEKLIETRVKNDTQDKDDAKAHFALAFNYINEGDIDSALREYQIVKELDDVLASELYDQILSKVEN